MDNSDDRLTAYTAATRTRDMGSDIQLFPGGWEGIVSDGTTIWAVDVLRELAEAISAPGTAQVATGGSAYTTTGDVDGVVTQALTGIGNNASFAITVTGSGFVEVYPQC